MNINLELFKSYDNLDLKGKLDIIELVDAAEIHITGIKEIRSDPLWFIRFTYNKIEKPLHLQLGNFV